MKTDIIYQADIIEGKVVFRVPIPNYFKLTIKTGDQVQIRIKRKIGIGRWIGHIGQATITNIKIDPDKMEYIITGELK